MGVERVPRVTGAEDGLPRLEDGRRLHATNVVWCTGFHSDFSWIELPVLGPREPHHDRGIVTEQPGLYFIGLKFLYSVSSEQIHGVGRDAQRIASAIAARRGGSRTDGSRNEPQQREEKHQMQGGA